MKRIPFESSAVRSTVKGVLLGSTIALPLMAAAFPAVAADRSADVEQLKTQLQELQDKVASLETQNQSQKDNSDKDGFSISRGGMQVGNTTVTWGGYVKLDAIYDLNEDLGTSAVPSNINPTLSRDEISAGHTRLQAQQSRLYVDSTTHTSMGDINGHIEGDFFGAGGNQFESNSYGFRLRQAYFTWNNWLFGQAWTTFSDFHYGTTLDFWGPEGQIFARQAQIRYTFHPSDTSNIAVAVENPNNNLTANAAALDANGNLVVDADGNVVPVASAHNNPKAPDLIARYQFDSGPLSFQVAGLARYLSFDNGPNGDDSTIGWGADIGASYSLPTGTTLMATFTGGKGIGRYLYAGSFQGGLYVDDSGDADTVTAWGGTATISQVLTPKLTTNLVYGFGKVGSLDNPTPAEEVAFATTGELVQDVHANLIYQVTDDLMFGIEYIYTYYSQQNGEQGDANRIQFATQYNF